MTKVLKRRSESEQRGTERKVQRVAWKTKKQGSHIRKHTKVDDILIIKN